MRVIIQRVSSARISVKGKLVSEIGAGILIFLGIHKSDTMAEAKWLADKCINLRIFSDYQEKMNLSLLDIRGEVLVVSQFTLYGDASKGRRPNFGEAASPEMAGKLYEYFIACVHAMNVSTKSGIFQAAMKIDLSNDGPVTIILEKNSETEKALQ